MNITTPIGDRPLSLATHLRAAVDLLLDEANTQYSWDNMTQCNCGLLARCITDWTDEKRMVTHAILQSRHAVATGGSLGWWTPFADDYAGAISWTGHVKNRCFLTGTPMLDVINTLFAAGMEESDFQHVEYLSHPDLSEGISQYTLRGDAAAYLLKWAQVIEAYHAAKVGVAPEVTERPILDIMSESCVLRHH